MLRPHSATRVLSRAVAYAPSVMASHCALSGRIVPSYGAVDRPHVRITLASSTTLDAGAGGGKGRIGGSDGSSGGGSGGGGGGGGRGRGNWWSRPFGAYMYLLETRPLATKVVTSGLISAASDVIAQRVSGEEQLSWRRVAALGAVGALLTAPIFHYLYDAMERCIPVKAGWRNTAAQLAVDQLLGAPVWLAAFFSTVAAFELAPDTPAIAERMRTSFSRDYVASLILTWKIFVPCQLVSFAYLPTQMRVLALNVVDLAYTAALSYISHEKGE